MITWDHDEFPSLYIQLLKQLTTLSIFSPSAYHSTRDSLDYLSLANQQRLRDMEFGFTRNCAALTSRFPGALRDLDGVGVLILGAESTLSRSAKSQLLVYSDTTVLETDPIKADTIEWEWDPHAIPSDDATNVTLGPDISGPIRTMFDHVAEVRSGLFVPIPRQLDVVDPDELHRALNKDASKRKKRPRLPKRPPISSFPGEEITAIPSSDIWLMEMLHEQEARDYRDREDFGDIVDPLGPITTPTKLPQHVFRLLGDQVGNNSQVLKLGLRVPSIASLDPVAARRLRQDHYDEFQRFQRALVKLSAELGNRASDDATRFRLVLQEVTDEIAKLQDKFSQLRRRYKSMQGITALLSIALCVGALHPAIAAIIQGAIAGAVGTSTLEFFRVRQELQDIEQHPLYFGMRAANSAAQAATSSAIAGSAGKKRGSLTR